MKKLTKNIILLTAFFFSAAANSQTNPQVCYGDQGVDIEAPYILTVHNLQLDQVNLITEDFLQGSTVRAINVYSFEPSAIYVLAVNPHIPASNEEVDRNVRSSVANVLKKYEIADTDYALECNGSVTGLPRAGGAN